MSVEVFLQRRRDRACAIILGVMDRELIDDGTKARLRKVVLDQVNDLYQAAMDVMPHTGTVVVNEAWLEQLDEIHSIVVRNGKG